MMPYILSKTVCLFQMWWLFQMTRCLPIAGVHEQFAYGGGLHFFKAQNNSVIITGCKFRNNRALWGGG